MKAETIVFEQTSAESVKELVTNYDGEPTPLIIKAP